MSSWMVGDDPEDPMKLSVWEDHNSAGDTFIAIGFTDNHGTGMGAYLTLDIAEQVMEAIEQILYPSGPNHESHW